LERGREEGKKGRAEIARTDVEGIRLIVSVGLVRWGRNEDVPWGELARIVKGSLRNEA
jgi:hypothetical protein